MATAVRHGFVLPVLVRNARSGRALVCAGLAVLVSGCADGIDAPSLDLVGSHGYTLTAAEMRWNCPALENAVQARVTRAGPQDAALIASADLTLDAADNFATSYALSDLCFAAGKPLISASVLGMAGFVGGFCSGAPSYRAVFPKPDAAAGTCATAGVLGPAVAVLGAMQAQMALSVLLGMTPSPLGRMVTLDLQRWRFGGFEFAQAEEVAGFAFITSPLTSDTLIDLRAAPSDLTTLVLSQGRIVLACKTGLRAWHAAEILAARGAKDVVLLADGQ